MVPANYELDSFYTLSPCNSRVPSDIAIYRKHPNTKTDHKTRVKANRELAISNRMQLKKKLYLWKQ